MDLKNLLIILFALCFNSITGQSFEISGLFTTSELNDFKNTFGYDLGYNFKNNKRKQISIHLSHCIKNASYDETKIDKESNGPQYPEYYFYKINSQNQRLGLFCNFEYNLFDNDFSAFGIGSSLSYYFFTFDKKTELIYYRPFPDNFIQDTESESKYNKLNRIGVDLFIEFELKSVLVKKINIFSRLNAGLITYGTIALEKGGWDNPWLTKWFTINLGLSYDLNFR